MNEPLAADTKKGKIVTRRPPPGVDRIALERECAVEGVDVRSVVSRLSGHEVRGRAGSRADRVLARLGLTPRQQEEPQAREVA